jgi:thioesterase domain-containing protein
VIAGYCAGCTIAFELARQLSLRGAAISFVALFGSYPSSYRLLPRLAQLGKRMVTHAHALVSLSSFEERYEYLAERLRKGVMPLLVNGSPDTKDPVLVLRERVQDVTMTAVRRYTPSHFAGRVSLFFPNREWARFNDAPMLWRSVSQRTDDYFGPDDCNASNMLLEPHAKAIADLFRRSCENSKTEEAPSRANRHEDFFSIAPTITSGGHPAN